jgi:hypothetical protein
VELDRTWTSDSQGRVAHLVDSWRSTDGQQHTLQIQYESSYSTSAAGSTLDFPGSSGYQDYAAGDSVTLPSGTGTIYFKYDGTTPDAGDGTNPQGAVTYETAPDAPASIEGRSSSGIEWLLPYNPTIPAGGTVTLRFNWSQAFSRSDLDSFAQQAIASWQPPPPPPQQQHGPPSSPNTGTPPQQQTEAPGLALIGKVKTTGNGFSFTLACTNGPCNGGATLTTTELLKGSKVLHLARTKHKKVTIGRTTFTIASGGHKTITVKLNAAGKKLLKRFNKLPAKLSVTLNGKTVVAKKATLKKR